MNILEGLRRLFAPRTPTAAKRIGEPTADRPPPPDAAEAESGPLDVIPGDDVQEVRAALAAVTEPTVPTPVSDAPAPTPAIAETPTAAPALDETPTAAPASTPSLTPAATEEAVDAAASDRLGDVLVLTLATPAARFTVMKTAATIGRGQENTVRLDDLSVSRRHARIAYRKGGYWLSDLGSMGGTWVDGARLNAPHRLAAGQVIDIGLCRLTVSAAGGAATAEGKQSPSRSRSEMAGQGRRRR